MWYLNAYILKPSVFFFPLLQFITGCRIQFCARLYDLAVCSSFIQKAQTPRPSFSHHPSPGRPQVCSLWVHLHCVLAYTYEWYHDICLSLSDLHSMIMSRSIPVALNGIILLFFMAQWSSIAYTYHIFLHSSADGHLGCYHVLAIVNSAAKNIRVHVSFWILVCLDICPGVGLLDDTAFCEEPPYCLPERLHQSTFPPGV